MFPGVPVYKRCTVAGDIQRKRNTVVTFLRISFIADKPQQLCECGGNLRQSLLFLAQGGIMLDLSRFERSRIGVLRVYSFDRSKESLDSVGVILGFFLGFVLRLLFGFFLGLFLSLFLGRLFRLGLDFFLNRVLVLGLGLFLDRVLVLGLGFFLGRVLILGLGFFLGRVLILGLGFFLGRVLILFDLYGLLRRGLGIRGLSFLSKRGARQHTHEHREQQHDG